MTKEEIKQLEELIMSNDTLTEEDKEKFVRSLLIFNEYNIDLNKDKSIIKLMKENKEFLDNDAVNREDYLLKFYHLTNDSTLEEIEEERDSILFDLEAQGKETKYLDKARRIREKAKRVAKDFEYIISHLDKRSLPGELNEDTLKKKADTLHEYGELLDSLLEFAISSDEDKVDKKKDDFEYNYEGMTDEEIAKARAEIEEQAPLFFSYDEEVHDYLEPIEYFPNTNIRKPRNRGAFESVEHYNAFLEDYYSKYDFKDAKEHSVEQPQEFYDEKLDYTKNRFQVYFGHVKDALADLRWLYNHALNDGKEDPTLSKFAKEYEAKVDSINAINTKLFNEQSLKGDVVLNVELEKDSEEVNARVSTYISLIDEENRKKYANYTVSKKTQNRTLPNDYKFTLDKVTNKALDEMITEFVDSAVENIDGMDKETVLKSNMDVVIDGKHYVMPVEDFGLNSIKILQLGPKAYVKRSTYMNKNVVENNITNDKDLTERINTVISGTVGEGMPTPEEQFEQQTGEKFDPDKYEVQYEGAETLDDSVVTPFTIVEKVEEAVKEEEPKEEKEEEIEVPEVKTEEAEQFEPIPQDIVDEMISYAEEQEAKKTEETNEEEKPKFEPFNEKDAAMDKQLEDLGKEDKKDEDLSEEERLDKMLQEALDRLPDKGETKEETKAVDETDGPFTDEDFKDMPDQIFQEGSFVGDEEEAKEETTKEEVEEEKPEGFVYPPIMPIGIEDKQEKVELIEQKDEQPVETEEKKEEFNDDFTWKVEEPKEEKEPEIIPGLFDNNKNVDKDGWDPIIPEDGDLSKEEKENLNKMFDEVNKQTDEELQKQEDEEGLEETSEGLEEGIPDYETYDEYYNDEKHQERVSSFYKIVAKKKADHTKKSIAVAALGAAAAVLGAVASSGIGVALSVGGAAVIDGVINRKNLYRLAQKQKLKRIAKDNGAKVFFSRSGKVEMRSLDGFKLNEEQLAAIQDELDLKVNAKLDPAYVPRVTVDNLEYAFTIDTDQNVTFVASKKDEKEYSRMKLREQRLFNEVKGDDDYYYTEDDIEKYLVNGEKMEPVTEKEEEKPEVTDVFPEEEAKVVNEDAFTDEYLEEMAASKRAAKAAIEDILYLNPGMKDDFKEDNEGYYISLEDPKSIILPEGFVYDEFDGFNNFGDESQVATSIKVIVPIKDYHDVVEDAIEKYGDTLIASDDAVDQIFEADSEFRYDTLVAARDRLLEKKKTL